MLERAELADTGGYIHGKEAGVIIAAGIEAPYHLLLMLSREELVVMKVMLTSSSNSSNSADSAANQIDSYVRMVLVVGVGGSCSRGGDESSMASDA